MKKGVKKPKPWAGENRLTLAEVLEELVEEKMVDAEAAAKVKKERRYYRGTLHPLVIVAEQKWKKGSSLLTLDALSEWLAQRGGLEYLPIDPPKIHLTAGARGGSVGPAATRPL